MFAIPPSLHVNYHVWEPPMSHMGINMCVHCPLHLPKKVSKKRSINHIGSSMSHQLEYQGVKNFTLVARLRRNTTFHAVLCS